MCYWIPAGAAWGCVARAEAELLLQRKPGKQQPMKHLFIRRPISYVKCIWLGCNCILSQLQGESIKSVQTLSWQNEVTGRKPVALAFWGAGELYSLAQAEKPSSLLELESDLLFLCLWSTVLGYGCGCLLVALSFPLITWTSAFTMLSFPELWGIVWEVQPLL